LEEAQEAAEGSDARADGEEDEEIPDNVPRVEEGAHVRAADHDHGEDVGDHLAGQGGDELAGREDEDLLSRPDVLLLLNSRARYYDGAGFDAGSGFVWPDVLWPDGAPYLFTL